MNTNDLDLQRLRANGYKACLGALNEYTEPFVVLRCVKPAAEDFLSREDYCADKRTFRPSQTNLGALVLNAPEGPADRIRAGLIEALAPKGGKVAEQPLIRVSPTGLCALFRTTDALVLRDLTVAYRAPLWPLGLRIKGIEGVVRLEFNALPLALDAGDRWHADRSPYTVAHAEVPEYRPRERQITEALQALIAGHARRGECEVIEPYREPPPAPEFTYREDLGDPADWDNDAWRKPGAKERALKVRKARLAKGLECLWQPTEPQTYRDHDGRLMQILPGGNSFPVPD